jgi:hypothetical protein
VRLKEEEEEEEDGEDDDGVVTTLGEKTNDGRIFVANRKPNVQNR